MSPGLAVSTGTAVTTGTARGASTPSVGRRRRAARRRRGTAALLVLVLALAGAALMVGHTFYSPADVIRVLLGQDVPGASFTVGELRLPRTALGVLAGACLGAGGVTFQTLLRNPLAAPDVIGISSGASVAAVIAVVVFSLSGPAVSALAIAAALATALVIHVLAHRDGAGGARLVLFGIGVAAMLDSAVLYVLSRASDWDLQTAMRWLTGSLGGATWAQAVPVALALALVGPLLLAQERHLAALQLGDDAAGALGVPVERTRLLCVVTAVALIAFATAAAGPIAFVSFLAGPIAARVVGPGARLAVPAALVGAALVVAADLLGQWCLGTRYPVGVITGALGAPYLVVLLLRPAPLGGSS